MSKVEILCTTMQQESLDLVCKMNIRSDVVFSNQGSTVGYVEEYIDGIRVRMVSTQTRGVGRNRNIGLLYSEGDILLFSDDDMRYVDNAAMLVASEFDSHPDADVFIFNITTNTENRKQLINRRTKRLGKFDRLPYGAPRIAIRKSAWEKSNVWFTTLFGGGAKYSSGEDSIFLYSLKKKGLTMYVSDKFIGEIDMLESSWFHGRDKEYYFNKGAYCQEVHRYTIMLWKYYYCIFIPSELSVKNRIEAFENGLNAYKKGMSFKEFVIGK